MGSDSDGCHYEASLQRGGTSPTEKPPVEVEKKLDRAVHREENHNQAGITNQALVDRINRSDRWMIGLTAVIAAGGIISAIIFGQQLTVMQGQLDAMERDQRPYVWITDHLSQPEFRQAGGTNLPIGQIAWSWEFTNFGNGRAIGLTGADYIRMNPNGVFKRSYGVKGLNYGGDLPKGKTNFNTTISEPIQKADFDKLMTIDGGISILIEFKFSDLIGKTQETAACLVRLASGAVQIGDPAKCKKSKEQ